MGDDTRAQLTLAGDPMLDMSGVEALEAEAAYTPLGVALQLLSRARGLLRADWTMILDPSAGSGCFGAAARSVFGSNAWIAGIEPRDERLPADYDDTHRETFERWAERGGPGISFDIIATNPPFSLVRQWLPMLRALLKPGGLLVLLLPVDWWQRSASLYEFATLVERRHNGTLVDRPLLAQWVAPNLWDEVWTIGGPIGFRGPGTSSDFRNYAGFVWRAAPRVLAKPAPYWAVEALPWLPACHRRWSLPPGRDAV